MPHTSKLSKGIRKGKASKYERGVMERDAGAEEALSNWTHGEKNHHLISTCHRQSRVI